MSTRPEIPDEQMRLAAIALNPPTAGMMAAGAEAANPGAEQMRRDSGEEFTPFPENRRGTRGSPTPGEAKAQRAGRQPGGPGPSKIAATRGVMGDGAAPVAADVPRETPRDAARVPPEQDRPAFDYLDAVQAGVAEAMRRGRTDVAEQIQGEYANLVAGQFRAMESRYETETLPQVHAIRSAMLQHNAQTLPRELAMKANEVISSAAAQQRRMLAYAYGLERNAFTQGAGVRLFNDSKLIEPGVTLDHLEVRDGNLIGLDQQGQIVKLSSGADFVIPVEQAEALYASEFESDKGNLTKLAPGETLVDAHGQKIAENPKDAVGSPSERLSAVKAAADVIATRFGARQDPVTRMIDPDSIKDQAGYTQALAEVEQLVRSGVPPMDAANQVAQKYQQQAPGNAAATEYTGPRPWR